MNKFKNKILYSYLIFTAILINPVNAQESTPIEIRPKKQAEVKVATDKAIKGDLPSLKPKIIIKVEAAEQLQGEESKVVQKTEPTKKQNENKIDAIEIKSSKVETEKNPATALQKDDTKPEVVEAKIVEENIKPKLPEIEESKAEFKDNEHSLNSYIGYYEYSYDKTLAGLLSALSKNNFNIDSFNSKYGEVICNYYGKKQFYAIIRPSGSDKMLVRITPVNGNYNFPKELISKVFKSMKGLD